MKLTSDEKKFLRAVAKVELEGAPFTYAELGGITGLTADQLIAAEHGLKLKGALQAVPRVTNLGLAALAA